MVFRGTEADGRDRVVAQQCPELPAECSGEEPPDGCRQHGAVRDASSHGAPGAGRGKGASQGR